MSNTYGAPGSGSSLTDLVSTLQNIARNGGGALRSLSNAIPPATASDSPVATGINTLGTTATTVIAANPHRHGIVFINPAPATTIVYVFPTAIATAPTTGSLGGALPIAAGGSASFPSAQFPNVNCGFSAFASAGTTAALTIWEFL